MMEFKKNDDKMSKNRNECGGIDYNNITLMTTPRPQACSTVERKE